MSPKQKAFIEHYLRDPKRNKTQAAINAGYSKKNAASKGVQLSKLPEIVKLLKSKEKSMSKKTEITVETQLQKLKQAFTLAVSKGRPGDMIKCVEVENKMLGLNAADGPESVVNQLNIIDVKILSRDKRDELRKHIKQALT